MAKSHGDRGKRPRRNRQKKPPSSGANKSSPSSSPKVVKDWGRANFWLTFAGAALAAVVAIGVAYWGLRSEGAFDKSDVSLELTQDVLDQARAVQIFVAVNVPFNAEDRVLVPVRLSVKNTGERVLSNVRITLQYAARARVTDIDLDRYMEVHGSLLPGDSVEKTNPIGEDGDVYTNFKFEELNLDQSRSIEYALQAGQPDFSKDEVLPTVRQVAVKVLLQADGVQRKVFYLNYNVVSDDGFDALVGSYRRFYDRLGRVVLGRHSYTDYLLSANYRAAVTSSGRVLLPYGNFKEGRAVVKAVDRN